MKSIGDWAFEENKFTTNKQGSHRIHSCGAVRSITLPSSINSLGMDIFFNNPNLKTVVNKTGMNVSDIFDSSPTITN